MTKTIAVDAVIVVVQTPVRDVMKTTKNMMMRLNTQKNPSVFVFVVIEMWEEVGGVRSVCVGGEVVGTADYIIVVRGS